MLKVNVRKIGALITGAVLVQGAINCTTNTVDEVVDERSAYQEDIASASQAYTVENPGSGTLKVDYYYSGGNYAPQKQFQVFESTTDEFVRAGEHLALEIPGWIIVNLVQTEYDSINNDNLPNVTGKVKVTFLRNGAPVSSVDAPITSWKDGDYGWKAAMTDVFEVPAAATSMKFSIEVTSPDTGKSGVEEVGETMVFGGELPNKHVFFDVDNGTVRQRMLEGGKPVAGAELVTSYASSRADHVAHAFDIDRRVGKVKVSNPRFGTMIQDVYAELVHEVSVGYSFDGASWSEDALVTSPKSYVKYGSSQEGRIRIPSDATRLLTYFHIKSYLVAKFPTGCEIVEQKYADGQKVLVAENWDNPAGAGTNFEYGTELPEDESPDFKRTVVFIEGETAPGQDMFIRGGIDHEASKNLLGVECADASGAANYLCAIPIRHRNWKNATTASWKLGEGWLDWYGVEGSQTGVSKGTRASGSAADWTTNNWPASYGAQKTVPVDGYGLEELNTYGIHYWMLDVDMDCSKGFVTDDGTSWFEVKSFISNGPGWEADVAQAATPYASKNHFAKCGEVSVFKRGSSTVTFVPISLPE